VISIVVSWLAVGAIAVAVTIGTSLGAGVASVWLFSQPEEDGHATAAALGDAFHFVVGAVFGLGLGLVLAAAVTALLFVGCGRLLGLK
jgi:hypothetical protein